MDRYRSAMDTHDVHTQVAQLYDQTQNAPTELFKNGTHGKIPLKVGNKWSIKPVVTRSRKQLKGHLFSGSLYQQPQRSIQASRNVASLANISSSHRSKQRISASKIYDQNFDGHHKRKFLNTMQKQSTQQFAQPPGPEPIEGRLGSSVNSNDSEFKRQLRQAKAKESKDEKTITVPAIKLMSKIQSVQHLDSANDSL
jgi:hypothetical protein